MRYGGHTSCVAVQADGETIRLPLDAGTGMQAVNALLDGPFDGTVLLGHLHGDHTLGMPFFSAGGQRRSRVRVLLPERGTEAEALLAKAMSPPHFPIRPAELDAGWRFESLAGVWPTWRAARSWLSRSRTEAGRRTDTGSRGVDDRLPTCPITAHACWGRAPTASESGTRTRSLSPNGVDVLVHDAQHLAEEFPGVE